MDVLLFLQDLLTSIPNFSKYLPGLVGMVSSLHLHGLSSTVSVSIQPLGILHICHSNALYFQLDKTS